MSKTATRRRTIKPTGPARQLPQPCNAEHAKTRSAERGWAFHQLALIEFNAAGRWAWWLSILMTGWLDDREIPRVEFTWSDDRSPYTLPEQMNANATTRSELLKDAVRLFQECERHGVYRSTVLDYWLYAFGDHDTERPKLPDVVEVLLYQTDVPWRMLFHPADWGAKILCEFIGRAKDHTAWFPTPIHVAELMVQMTMGDGDMRLKTFMEPCVGTGCMLLVASNRSLRLYGCDIDPEMVRWTKLACYLYVPWVVKPGDLLIREMRAANAREREAKTEQRLLPAPTTRPHVYHATLFV